MMLAEHEFTSVWEVVRIYGHDLLRTQDMLARARRGKIFDDQVFNIERIVFIHDTLSKLESHLAKMKMGNAIIQLRRVQEKLKRIQNDLPEGDQTKIEAVLLGKDMDDLQLRIQDELITKVLYHFREEEKEMITQGAELFDKEVLDTFPEITEDLDEAVKCMGFSRWTAGVFHLMRAMESVLRAISVKLGVTIQDKDGNFIPWGTMLANINDRVRALPDAKERENWKCIASLLWAVKQCWRNDTMHPKQTYTDEQAKKVYAAVKIFLYVLAIEMR